MRALTLATLAACALYAKAQTEIVSLTVQPAPLAPDLFLAATIAHIGQSAQIQIEGEIVSDDGAPVIFFSSTSIPVVQGTQQLAFGRIPMRRFTYASTPIATLARREHSLPFGEYRVCARAIVGEELSTEHCEQFSSDEVIYLDLVEPWNKDTISEPRPDLVWSLSGAGSASGMDIQLVLTPMLGNDDAQRAIGSGVPVFILPSPSLPVVRFPAGVPSLEPGRCYAWQVSLLSQRVVVERSEAWSFCIQAEQQLLPEQYVVVSDAPSSSVHLLRQDRIDFRFDEPYVVDTIQCEVFDAKGLRLSPAADRVSSSGSVRRQAARNIGANHYQFDLSNYQLGEGRYELRIQDGKGRQRSILFQVENQ